MLRNKRGDIEFSIKKKDHMYTAFHTRGKEKKKKEEKKEKKKKLERRKH